MNHASILSLVWFNANLQLAHWQADTLNNEHRVLGELYEATSDLTDKLAEVAMGKDGNTDFEKQSIDIVPGAIGELLTAGLAVLASIRFELDAGPDDDLLNIVADMTAATNRAKYLLKV